MTEKIAGTAEARDDRRLGCDEPHIAVASVKNEAEIDRALGLKLISIRLPASLIADFKMLAATKGDIKYQALMRNVLDDYADKNREV